MSPISGGKNLGGDNWLQSDKDRILVPLKVFADVSGHGNIFLFYSYLFCFWGRINHYVLKLFWVAKLLLFLVIWQEKIRLFFLCFFLFAGNSLLFFHKAEIPIQSSTVFRCLFCTKCPGFSAVFSQRNKGNACLIIYLLMHPLCLRF